MPKKPIFDYSVDRILPVPQKNPFPGAKFAAIFFFEGISGDSDVGDIVMLATFMMVTDLRMIMLATFFVMLVIFSMY